MSRIVQKDEGRVSAVKPLNFSYSFAMTGQPSGVCGQMKLFCLLSQYNQFEMGGRVKRNVS